MKEYSVFFNQINATKIEVKARNVDSAAKKALKKYKKELLEDLEYIEQNYFFNIEEAQNKHWSV
jgi:hypothetical protein